SGERMSAQTFNFYLQAMKQFCKWMAQDRRASESPLEHLKGLNVRTDRRHDRRSLEPDELRRLLEATAAAPKRYGMSGPERYLLYRFAAETGLRANEVRNLKVRDFDFDRLAVTAKAGYSKRKREDVQPLRPDTAELLKDFFTGKMPNVKAFGGTYRQLTRRTSDMIKADLADAGIPYVDDAGRFADFHSLRHTTGSLLAASGVHPKVAQSIMRHSDINLTMSRYTHTLAGQEAKAVAGLPDLSLPSSEKQIATGTDDKSAEVVRDGSKKWTPKWTPELTPTAFSECNQSAAVGNRDKRPSETGTGHNHLPDGKLGTKRPTVSSPDKRRGGDSNPR
ncbi:MAG: tyrosine-type recombinase/integrase, partial [Planctomycetota bacterium]